ncbi:2-oxo-4-hydroxy-4-carboxy-5-ureidoimidazoline decarboxylase [Arthrobacter sp. GCM10027362]|uniref:2-oxo-4-hydroxy-4-carboxy-5-ureidoimidazoline decarboxylase n=1 Tax=Arthrobacter sp. GCM10027362 TaxID=3273379 RepID=UPI0036367F3D
MNLEEFNNAPEAEAALFLAPCAPIASWSHALVAGRPYASRRQLLEAARAQAGGWTDAEVDAALAHHPRIGEKPPQPHAVPVGVGRAEAEHALREQAGVRTDAATAAHWLEANRAYEQRFGRIFLIRAAGRSQAELFAQLKERLGNDDATEARVRAEQLAEIAVLRLDGQLKD